MKRFSILLLAAVALAMAAPTPAQEGQDNAGNAAYASSWANGSNGGTGFNAWNNSISGGNGSFDAPDATAVGGSAALNTGGRCFRARSIATNTSSDAASGVRTVTAAGSTSDVLRFDFQSQLSGTDTAAIARFADALGNVILRFKAEVASPDYLAEINASTLNTGIPRTAPVRVFVKLRPDLGPDKFDLALRRLDAPFTNVNLPNLTAIGGTYAEIFELSFAATTQAGFSAFGDLAQVLVNNLIYDETGDAGVQVPVAVSAVLID